MGKLKVHKLLSHVKQTAFPAVAVQAGGIVVYGATIVIHGGGTVASLKAKQPNSLRPLGKPVLKVLQVLLRS